MGVFEHFPYVNFHELNFSWMIAKIQELEDVIAHNIVDLVARAGVAANTQAINDLDTALTNLSGTVSSNATTAHNESLAAQNTANAAQTDATSALTKLTRTAVTVTPVNADLTIAENDSFEMDNIVYLDIRFVTTASVASGTILMTAPAPKTNLPVGNSIVPMALNKADVAITVTSGGSIAPATAMAAGTYCVSCSYQKQ